MFVTARTKFTDVCSRAVASLRGGFARDTFDNTIGLVVAAAVPLAIMPVLSRLYSPHDFGVFGVFMAFVSLASSAVTGRYEAAILIPVEDREALETAAVALLFALCFVSILMVAVVAGLAASTEYKRLAALGVIATAFSALVQVALSGAIRCKLFKQMSIARIAGAIVSAFVSAGLGWLGFGFWGLAFGMASGVLTVAIFLLLVLARQYSSQFRLVTLQGVHQQAKRFVGFLMFSLPSDLANNFASSLPVLFFSSLYGAAATGYLTMLYRVWSGSGLLVQGLSETFRQKAMLEYNATGKFSRAMRITLVPLAAMSAVLLLFLLFAGPTVFSLILGEHWRQSGVFGQILAPLLCAQFIASPLSWSFYIVEKLRLLMTWQLSLLACTSLVLWIGSMHLDAKLALAAYSSVGAALYLVYIVLSYILSYGTRDGAGPASAAQKG